MMDKPKALWNEKTLEASTFESDDEQHEVADEEVGKIGPASAEGPNTPPEEVDDDIFGDMSSEHIMFEDHGHDREENEAEAKVRKRGNAWYEGSMTA